MKSKKWLVQGIAILIMVVLFSVTVFAADHQISAVNTEKENPLEHSLYIRGQEEEALLTSVSEEEWKELKKEGKRDKQETAFVVFQSQKAPTEEVTQTDISELATETVVESQETNLPVSDEVYEKSTETQRSEPSETFEVMSEAQMSEPGEASEVITEAQMSEPDETYDETAAKTQMSEADEIYDETANTRMLKENELPVKIPETEMMEASNPVKTINFTKKQKNILKKYQIYLQKW